MKLELMKKVKGYILFFCLVVLTSHSSELLAQPEENKAKTKQFFHHELDSYIRYMPSREAESQSGKIEIIEAGSKYAYKLKALDKFPVDVALKTKYIGLENTTQVELPAHLTGITTDIETTLPFFNFSDTHFRIGISPSFYGDNWDFQSSSFRLPSRFYLIKRLSPKFTMAGGIAIFPDFENEILPILGFIWKPNDKLTFNIMPGTSNIAYLLNEKVILFVEGGGSLNNEFEVTRGDSKNVVLRYREVHLGSGIKFKHNQYIQSSISTGGVFNRSLKYSDNQGKVNIEDGLYTEFRLEIRF